MATPRGCWRGRLRTVAWAVAGLGAGVGLAALAGCASPAAPAGASATPTGAATPADWVPGLPPPQPTVCAPAAPGQAAPVPAALQRQLDPLDTPYVFTEHFYPGGERLRQPVQLGGSGGPGEAGSRTLAVLAQLDDPASGQAASVLLDRSNGHAVLLFRGMARPGIDPGGLAAVRRDFGIVWSARFDRVNPQLLAGERAFHQARCLPGVKTLELVGYSLGSQVVNTLAVRQQAVGTVFGDMGLDPAVWQMGVGAEGSAGSAGAQGLAGSADADEATRRAALQSRLVSLQLQGDLSVRVMGVGPSMGQPLTLGCGLTGLLHQPEVYVQGVKCLRAPISPSP